VSSKSQKRKHDSDGDSKNLEFNFILGGIGLAQAIMLIPTHFSSMVCLAVLCHVCVLCLNCSMGLDGI